ncbi:hypothetical protein D3C71_1994360 [compost metagenome]
MVVPTRLANSTRAGEFTAGVCNALSFGDREVVASVIVVVPDVDVMPSWEAVGAS